MGDYSFAADITQWEYISYCLSQLAFTEKGMKKLMESFKTYEHALSEDSVMDHFKNIINKALNYLIFMHHLIQSVQDMFSIDINSFFFFFFFFFVGTEQEVCKTRNEIVH
jgi:hypothetical protein